MKVPIPDLPKKCSKCGSTHLAFDVDTTSLNNIPNSCSECYHNGILL